MNIGDLVLIEWYDIVSDSSWTESEEIKPARCISVGFFGGVLGTIEEKTYYLLYASFNEGERGDRIVIPLGCTKTPIVLKKNAVKKYSRTKGLYTG